MPDEKELNPSPKFPDGKYPELSPNPKLEDGLVNRTNEQPNGSEETNPTKKPHIFDGDVYVEGGELYVNGKKVSTDDYDDKGFDVLELSNTLGTLTTAQYNLVTSEQCVIKLGTQYFYKEFSASTLISYKAFPHNVSDGTVTNDYIEITKSSKEWALVTSYTVKANPTLDGTEPELDGLQVGGKKYKAKSGGVGVDTAVTVEIENDYTSTDFANRTNYATPISLQEFITNCETGVYTNAGTIAKINNLLNEKAFRLILIGNDHEVLAYNDTTTAKTTWQFLDMPEHNVRLGLPFNVIDWVQGSGRAYLKQYLDGTNEAAMQLYPSNMDGLISAQGLLEVCHTVFESLPLLLKEAIKTVRRYYYRKRNYMDVAASGGSETNNAQMCQLACNVFHLAGTDLGTSGQSGEGSGSLYSYFNSNAKRVRFYNGSAASWWTASPNTSYSNLWYNVNTDGSGNNDRTTTSYGVAPAFCI